ncbi:MAG: hypothetical protein ABSE74_02065, partial [Methanoregula sp.]
MIKMIAKNCVVFTVIIIVVIMALVTPLASADEMTNVTSARAVSALPLPQLHFNNSQEKVAVTGELSPGKIIFTTPGAALTAHQNEKQLTLPFGAIIHHENNITTIFDQNGQQVLVADDMLSEMIPTISGTRPATFVHEVPNGSIIVNGGDKLYIVHNNTRILTIINANSNEPFVPTSNVVCSGKPYAMSWVEGAESQQITPNSGVSRFSADWNVPTSPRLGLTVAGFIKPVAIWDGISYCNNGDINTGLIQPVLYWNYPNPGWNLQTWYVWSNATTNANLAAQTDVIANTVDTQISTNDDLRGEVSITGNEVTGLIDDTATDMNSELGLTNPGYDPEWMSQPAYAQIVLEWPM